MYQYWQAVAPKSTMRWVSEVIIEVLGVAECVVLTRRNSVGALSRASHPSGNVELSERTLSLMDIAMQTSILAASGRVVAVENLNTPLAFPHVDLMRDAGFQSYLSFPFSTDSNLDGIICVADVEPRSWTAADKQFISDVSAVVTRLSHLERSANGGDDEITVIDVTRGEVSQELRAPLANMIGYLHIVLDEAVGPITRSQKQLLATVEQSAMKLLSTVDELVP